MRALFLPLITLSVALLGGCDSGRDHRAYSGLLDLDAVTVTNLRTTVPIPGRYNVSGTVVEITTCSCPPEALCAVCEFPNGLILSETGAPLSEDGYVASDATYLLVEAEDPQQFQLGQRYVLSVDVGGGHDRPVYLAQLLGYERATP